MMLDKLDHNHNGGRARRPGNSSYRLFSSTHYFLAFISWPRKWRENLKNEVKYRSGDENTYFIGWHNPNFSIVSP